MQTYNTRPPSGNGARWARRHSRTNRRHLRGTAGERKGRGRKKCDCGDRRYRRRHHVALFSVCCYYSLLRPSCGEHLDFRLSYDSHNIPFPVCTSGTRGGDCIALTTPFSTYHTSLACVWLYYHTEWRIALIKLLTFILHIDSFPVDPTMQELSLYGYVRGKTAACTLCSSQEQKAVLVCLPFLNRASQWMASSDLVIARIRS